MDAGWVYIAGIGCDGFVLGLAVFLIDVDMVWTNCVLDVFWKAKWPGSSVQSFFCDVVLSIFRIFDLYELRKAVSNELFAIRFSEGP